MNQTIIIRPAKGISINVSLPGSYLHPEKKTQVTLTMDKRIVEGALKETDKKFIYKFGEYNRSYMNKINLDSSDKQLKERAEMEKKFWSKHPHVKTVGGDNKYLINELFEMETLEDTQKKENEEDRQWLRIQNIVNNLDDKNRYDLCFFFGGNPSNKNADEIWTDLIGRGGRLSEKQNMVKLIEIMTDEKKMEVVDRTIVKKAIHYGIIVTENNKYWTKQRDLLGMSEDDIHLYYKAAPDAFKFIKQEVEGLDINAPIAETKKK